MWTVVPFIALWVAGGYYIYKVYPYGSYHISDGEKLLLSVMEGLLVLDEYGIGKKVLGALVFDPTSAFNLKL